jgi:hypothetical protein
VDSDEDTNMAAKWSDIVHEMGPIFICTITTTLTVVTASVEVEDEVFS